MTPWKLASTLILASSAPKNIFNYKLLLLQRTSRSSFFPNASVFPGGNLDPSDYSYQSWGPLLKKMKLNKNSLIGRMRHPMYKEFDETHQENKTNGTSFHAEIVFRLCALRETFEETGILLGQDVNGNRVCTSSKELCNEKQIDWQNHVKNNPHSFAELFTSLNLTPDISNLHEWAGWLTPSNFPIEKRYDTAFYLTTLPPNTKANISPDETESVKAKWLSPLDWLDSHFNSETQFAPPQFYELGRLCQFTSWEVLESYSKERAVLGSERWTPIIYFTDDESLRMMVYPGDQRYPLDNPEVLPPTKVDFKELNFWVSNDTKRNRLIKYGKQWYDRNSPFYYDVNVDRLGHVPPIPIEELNKLKAQLS